MTTLAYKDGVLAADSRVSAGLTNVGTTIKIKQTPKYLVGIAGNLDIGQQFIRWVQSDFNVTAKPFVPIDSGYDIAAIVVDKKGRIRTYDNLLIPTEYSAKFYALGSGSDFALGAMAHGATAREAVKIAAKFDIATGSPFRSVTFKKGNSAKR